ncbi:hypothetical protein BHE74_00024665 [Ensete ventricosum]|nr:hypothetical protein BHE74_00024665 [Ensete ventricosum]
MPYLVRDRLFFGDITAAAEVLKNGSPEITHVLSLLSSASISFFSDWRSEISIPTEEIRKVFAGADGSPRKSLAPGKLVYSLERAGPELKLVRMAVPLRDTEDENLLDYLDVCLDFIDQGRKEGGVLVHCFAGVSRRYLGHSYKQGEKIDSYIFAADPGLPLESNSSEEVRKGNQHTSAYRCKKCRRIVASQENVVSHVPGENETCFDWQKRKSVEDGALEGKLLCIKCDARLGYFNWSGIQCSCGSWITPAFQIHKSKVDISMV